MARYSTTRAAVRDALIQLASEGLVERVANRGARVRGMTIEEAVEWVRRSPDPMPGEESEIEIRPVFEAEDFGAEFTPELREQEERLRRELESKK